MLRSPDDQYVKNLKGEFLRRPIPFGAPFLCIVKGIPDADQFDNHKLDGYVYEMVGGNHRRLALQQILRDEGVQDDEKEKFKCVNVQLYAGERYLSVYGYSIHIYLALIAPKLDTTATLKNVLRNSPLLCYRRIIRPDELR